ncbi:MAG TPA: DUF294 nucleotidyltransferase-like domain-containing protein, partial [Bacteroidales bacterium]|nr:DUF294 nucleotidyltransferase-like domain-containing protein [Bacteroidales bacterium]
MEKMHLKRFFVSIVIPSILAVVFFVLLIFLVVLPAFERNIMDGKKATISELTSSAISLLEEYYNESEAGMISADSARMLAAERIREVRYGAENKDYFWICDMQPKMVMHPYRPELEGSDLDDYRDPEGVKLFVEAVKVVSEQGAGYIDYMWQWKDDSTRIVPKLSYVAGFEPWGWVVGTGVYLEDVRKEIKSLKNRLLRITLLFTLLIAAVLAFIIRQSLRIERERSAAEKKLNLSRLKYKSLVEASTEGTLMLVHGSVVFSNEKFSLLSGYDTDSIRELGFDGLFAISWEKMKGLFSDPGKSISTETELHCKDGLKKEVVISASMVTLVGEKGYIIIVKEVRAGELMEKEAQALSRDLKASLQLMNQPVKSWIKPIVRIPVGSTIQGAAELMDRRATEILFVEHDQAVIGVINSSDLRKRVVSAGLDVSRPVSEVMTSPVVAIRETARMYEVMLALEKHKISHVATTNPAGEYTGVIGFKQLYAMQQNTISYMLREIEQALEPGQLKRIYQRVPVLVQVMLSAGEESEVVTRMLSSVADAIHRRVIALAIENQGEPPCKFAFMVMGSEGRMEPTLATDQDNAIVFEVVEEEREQQVKNYFLRLAEQVNSDLHKVGYAYCKGEVMAVNPRWTQPISVWEQYFNKWVNNSTPEDVLDAAIFFDFRHLYGEENLVMHLRRHVHQLCENKAVFMYHLAQGVLNFKPPVNIFSKLG